MSYYNQPDHELLDRRDPKAREILHRLAQTTVQAAPTAPAPAPGTSSTGDLLGRWRIQAAARKLAPPDAEALNGLPLAWREHYVAATLEPTDTAALADKGFEVITFGTDETGWNDAFVRLTKALGS
jgi:hypothetical protein